MKAVRYLHPQAGAVRVLRTKDLDQLGIKHKDEDLVWNQENNFTIVMNNHMSDSLVEMLPTEFVAMDTDEADEAPEVPEPMTSLAPSGTESDMGFPESSVSSHKHQAQ
jgi:hypothetical protein